MFGNKYKKGINIIFNLVAGFILLLGLSNVSNATEITSFSPPGGAAGTIININGNGFTGTDKVLFHNRAGRLLNANFTVESNSSIHVTAPENPWGGLVSFIITSPQGATVSLLESRTTRISTETVSGGGSRVYYVESTGFLNGLGGSNIVYVEAGGTVINNGSGSNIFFVESGATLNCCGGGGSNIVFYELGAVINNTDGGLTSYAVVDVKASLIDSLYNYDYVPVNLAPTANAGVDSIVEENAPFTLDGSASNDPESALLTYNWVQTAGPSVLLDNATHVTPSFVAPYVMTNQIITFELVVNDGALSSSPDTVDVVIKQTNNPPIADAGDDVTVSELATSILDGSNSYDLDGDTVVSYLWTQVSGPVVTLTPDNTSVIPHFTAPAGSGGSTLIFNLQVSDGMEVSVPSGNEDSTHADTVAIEIVANSSPVSNAGSDNTSGEGAVVELNGSASFDPDGGDTLVFAWTQISGPTVTLSDASIVRPMFIAPAVVNGGADLKFELTVTDDSFELASDKDSVNIHVMNVNDPPSCDKAVPSVVSMWPPNHKMNQVTVNNVMDDNDAYGNITLAVTGITQDEFTNGLGDGDTAPDAVLQQGAIMNGMSDAVLLRAERSSLNDGRVYTINFTANDGFESCEGSVQIGVPHSRKSRSVDSGQTYDSTTQ